MSKAGFVTVQILLFGPARESVGHSTLHLDVKEGVSLADLKSQLEELYPSLKQLKSMAFAVNESFESLDFLISEGDTVALIPPVSGG